MDDTGDQPITGETYTSSMTSSTSSVKSLTGISSVSSLSSLEPLTPCNDQRVFPPSLFPCLDSRPGSNSSWQSTEVPFKDVDILQSYCAKNEVSALAVFQTAWAFVLRCYLNNSSVCFIYSSSKRENGENTVRSSSNRSVCQVDFEAGNSVSDIIRRASIQCTRIPSHPMKSQPFVGEQSNNLETLSANTCLVYSEENQQDWSGVVRSTIKSDTSASPINVSSIGLAPLPLARLLD